MRIILWSIGFLWCLPTTLIAAIFTLIPAYCLGGIAYMYWDSEYKAWIWWVKAGSIFDDKVMDGWVDGVAGAHIIMSPIGERTATRNKQILKHASRHVYQHYCLGIFFYLVYIACTTYIWFFKKDKHSYYDNPLERAARKYAGEKVDIPRKEWAQGINDRFPWI